MNLAGSFIILFFASQAYSQVDRARLESIVDGGLQNVINLQKQTDHGTVHWKGEWPSYMINVKRVIALGPKGKQGADSNCFTTTLIHNELSKYVLRNDELSKPVAKSLDLALKNIMTFKSSEGTFNFWHSLPMADIIKAKAQEDYRDVQVKRPNNYELKNTFAAVRSNIGDDADDTAVAYSAIYFNQQLHEKYADKLSLGVWKPDSVTAPLEKFRDLNRTRNFVNGLAGVGKNTGAFLTWLTPQNSSFVGSVFKGWDDNLRIPDGQNNVDCVVNANVLQMLAHYGKQSSESAQAACSFIEKSIDDGLIKKCGYYYPNPYNLHFAVASAYEAGVSCLRNSSEKLYYILSQEQNSNGSWGWVVKPNKIKVATINEPTGSSVYAANAFFIFADKLGNQKENRERLDLAASFLIHSAQLKADSTYGWEPGVFFSGGSFVRRLVVWKSEAYTTMLAIQALDRYKHLENQSFKKE